MAALAVITLAANADEIVWQEDWDTVGHDIPTDETIFDIADVQDVEELEASDIRSFDHRARGGLDLIPNNGGGGTFSMSVEVLNAQYEADTLYTLHYLIGTGSSNGRNGNWFVEFGTISEGIFTSLELESTGDIELEATENFQDDENPTTTFGGDGIASFGGRELFFTFDPDAAAEGQNVAIRFGTTVSANFAGFSDMLISTGVPVATSPEITEIIYNEETDMITLTWFSIPGTVYAIEGSTDLQTWPLLITNDYDAAPEVSTTSSTFAIPDSRPEKQFFRVREVE